MQPVPMTTVAKVRRVLGDDLFRVQPLVYWMDFTVSYAIGWVGLVFTLPRFSSSHAARDLWMVVAALAFYRALFFLHELIHLRTPKLDSFRLVWNVLCGSMFFLPEFTYFIHSSHHLTAYFSTKDDPEYLPLAYQKPFELLAPLLILPFVPLLMMLRFLVIAPLSWIIGGEFWGWGVRNASSLKMNPKFQWQDISAEERRAAVRQEAAVLIWWALFIGAVFSAGQPRLLLEWYIVTYSILTLNHIRSVVAHGYTNANGER